MGLKEKLLATSARIGIDYDKDGTDDVYVTASGFKGIALVLLAGAVLGQVVPPLIVQILHALGVL